MKPRTLGGILVILLVGWWIYSPAMHGGWLWDDTVDIAQNPVMHDPAGWWKIWLTPSGWHFFPLKSTVQWAQWQLWENQTTGYHITNVVLHLVGALLLWRLFARLGIRHGWLGALLFTVHPLAVESVAWIAELKNTLSFPLLLLAALAWVDFDERGKGTAYVRCLLFFVAAMLAKSSVAMFPLCLLLYQAWKHGRLRRSDWRATAPLFAVSLALGLVTVWVEGQQNPAVEALLPHWDLLHRLAASGHALVFYFLKSIVPTRLSPVYPEWSSVAMTWLLVWVGLLAVASLAVRKWKTCGRHVALGLGIFVFNLLPVLGVIPMAYHHVSWVADHFAYLPLAGLAGLAAAGVDWCESRRGEMVRRFGGFLLLGASALYAWQAHRYAAVFTSEETLWTYAAETQPDAWLAHHDLAFEIARSHPNEAISHYQTALRLKPTDADAANNLGNILLAANRTDDAIAAYEQAIRIRPTYAEAQANLGNAYARAGRKSEAAAACARALQLAPENVAANITLGDLYTQNGQGAAALPHYLAALVHQPNDPFLLNNTAALQLQLGRRADARGNFERAVELSPAYVEPRVNLGYLFVESGQNNEAIAQWQEALRLAPDTSAAQVGLANLYVQTDRPAAAEQLYRAALVHQPDDAEVRNNLAYA
ncbi:MAG: hypothetical protein JWM35_1745, partial [Verrucomicrobia bacterium]|nr:hypothetical protein [Verrucomicrobiota bacterium]